MAINRRARQSEPTAWAVPILEGPLQAAVGDSVIKGFIEAHSPADVLRELVQNEYDARGTRVVVDFFEQHLRIIGNGDGIDSAGWHRLSLLLGTGRAIGSPDLALVGHVPFN
jgi:hypothetical protein